MVVVEVPHFQTLHFHWVVAGMGCHLLHFPHLHCFLVWSEGRWTERYSHLGLWYLAESWVGNCWQKQKYLFICNKCSVDNYSVIERKLNQIKLHFTEDVNVWEGVAGLLFLSFFLSFLGELNLEVLYSPWSSVSLLGLKKGSLTFDKGFLFRPLWLDLWQQSCEMLQILIVW